MYLNWSRSNFGFHVAATQFFFWQVNTLYLHRYDPETPLEDQAATFNEQYKKGMFKQVSHESTHTAAMMGFLH